MKTLAKAILDAIAFLEFSDDTVVDPDAAVSAIEMMVATLRDADPAELKALRAAAELQAERCRSFPGDPRAERFFREFMLDAGLADS